MRRLGGRFILEQEIGAGGMSVIFLGKDEVLERPVAVKVLRGGFEGSDVGARFRREGRTAARLSHPNIVQVYDAGEDELDGREVSYIVMEHVPGGDLGKLVNEKGPLGERDLARIGADVASGLAHAHRKGVVHRDIKPQNILIDDYGRPKLADFGIARALDATETSTKTGSYLGTASYSSPEQLRGAQITPKSDIYSLGCTLYEAAVGAPLFSGGPIATANQQLTKPPPPPRARGAALSEPFEDLVLGCLAKDPAARPDAAGLQERLLGMSAIASGAVSTAPTLGETTGNLAETAQEVGAAGAAGAARGFGAVIRGMRERMGSTSASQRTLFEPTQILDRSLPRGRNRRRTTLAAGILALLLLASVAAVGAPVLLGSGEEEAGQPEVAPPPTKSAETTTEETTAAPSRPAPPPSQAESVVWDMYDAASYQDANKVWSYLSQNLQDEVGSPERFMEREQFNNLSYYFFTQVPTAQVSGDTAEVGFQVRETRNYVPKLVSGTWECVNEDGEWKLNRLVRDNA